ncbi:hypothetical protein QVD17_41674 [Tagetes erecta]|uniref:Uncharacterized protein n=1 Tax=Tagetes erecta TaxID=13708 RepID=A0AAD8N924_TARER|nr:hypothetical protein QVD17_41674 [Tagetes erecta]
MVLRFQFQDLELEILARNDETTVVPFDNPSSHTEDGSSSGVVYRDDPLKQMIEELESSGSYSLLDDLVDDEEERNNSEPRRTTIVDSFEDLLQTVGMRQYFSIDNKKRKHMSKPKQNVPLSIVMERKGEIVGD